MDNALLELGAIESGAELIRRFNNDTPYTPVTAAFWLKRDEDDQRYLYVASHNINSESRGLAYTHLLKILNQIQSIYLDPSRVILISDHHRLAKAALLYNQDWNMATSLRSVPFANEYICDGYVYPQQMSTRFPKC